MNKKMLKFIFVFMFLFVGSAMAQFYDETLSNIESRIEKFEELSNTLTSQIEENKHNNKVQSEKIEGLIKSIDISIKNLKEDALKYENRMKEIEKSNMKLQKEMEALRKTISTMEEFIKTIPTKEPLSLFDSVEKSLPTDEPSKKEEELLLSDKEKEVQKDNVINDVAEYDEYKQARSLYNDKSYTESAIRFAEFIKKYPAGENFHSSLLYLGLSMKELGKVNNACQAFANIINSKEKVNEKVKKTASEEFEKLGCMNLNKKNGK